MYLFYAKDRKRMLYIYKVIRAIFNLAKKIDVKDVQICSARIQIFTLFSRCNNSNLSRLSTIHQLQNREHITR